MKNSSRGQHPNSQKNLIHTGRPSSVEIYGEETKTRSITVTETGWTNAKQYVKESGYRSVSEFMEMLGRGIISIPTKP
jgi:hypothetical protein